MCSMVEERGGREDYSKGEVQNVQERDRTEGYRTGEAQRGTTRR